MSQFLPSRGRGSAPAVCFQDISDESHPVIYAAPLALDPMRGRRRVNDQNVHPSEAINVAPSPDIPIERGRGRGNRGRGGGRGQEQKRAMTLEEINGRELVRNEELDKKRDEMKSVTSTYTDAKGSWKRTSIAYPYDGVFRKNVSADLIKLLSECNWRENKLQFYQKLAAYAILPTSLFAQTNGTSRAFAILEYLVSLHLHKILRSHPEFAAMVQARVLLSPTATTLDKKAYYTIVDCFYGCPFAKEIENEAMRIENYRKSLPESEMNEQETLKFLEENGAIFSPFQKRQILKSPPRTLAQCISELTTYTANNQINASQALKQIKEIKKRTPNFDYNTDPICQEMWYAQNLTQNNVTEWLQIWFSLFAPDAIELTFELLNCDRTQRKNHVLVSLPSILSPNIAIAEFSTDTFYIKTKKMMEWINENTESHLLGAYNPTTFPLAHKLLQDSSPQAKTIYNTIEKLDCAKILNCLTGQFFDNFEKDWGPLKLDGLHRHCNSANPVKYSATFFREMENRNNDNSKIDAIKEEKATNDMRLINEGCKLADTHTDQLERQEERHRKHRTPQKDRKREQEQLEAQQGQQVLQQQRRHEQERDNMKEYVNNQIAHIKRSTDEENNVRIGQYLDRMTAHLCEENDTEDDRQETKEILIVALLEFVGDELKTMARKCREALGDDLMRLKCNWNSRMHIVKFLPFIQRVRPVEYVAICEDLKIIKDRLRVD